MSSPKKTDLTDPLTVWRGCEAISEGTNKDKRQTYYALETGALPAYKEGSTWCLRPVTYLKHLEAQEAEAVAKREAKALAKREAKAKATESNCAKGPPPAPRMKPRRPRRRRHKPQPATKRGEAGDVAP